MQARVRDSSLEVAPLPRKRGWLRNKINVGEVVPTFQRPTSATDAAAATTTSTTAVAFVSGTTTTAATRPDELEVVAPFHSGSRAASPTHSSHGQGDPRFSGQNMNKESLDEMIVGSGLDGDTPLFASLRAWDRQYND